MPLKINPVTGELDLVLNPGAGPTTTSFDTDSGSAVPTGGGVITIAGGGGINTSGASNTVTINLDDPVLVVNGGTERTSLTDGSILVGDGTNAIELIGPLTDGQLLIGNTAAVSPSAAQLTAGTGISVVNGSGTITISSLTAGFTWNEETGTSVTLVVGNGYIANNAGLVTLTLPGTSALGDSVQIIGKGAGLFKIAQNAGNTINYVASSTTTGVGGSLTAIEQFASLELICTTANTDWTVSDSTGNFTVV